MGKGKECEGQSLIGKGRRAGGTRGEKESKNARVEGGKEVEKWVRRFWGGKKRREGRVTGGGEMRGNGVRTNYFTLALLYFGNYFG